MRINRIILMLALLCVTLCVSARRISNDNRDRWSVKENEVIENLILSSAQVYNVCTDAEQSSYSNIVFSPLSLNTYLSMLANATKGSSRKQITDILLPQGQISLAELNEFNKRFATYLSNTNEKNTLKCCNSFWYPQYNKAQKTPKFKQKFFDVLTQYYGSDMEAEDFSDSEHVKTLINEWCSQATDGKIQEMFSKSDELGDFVLVNTLFYKGIWQSIFQNPASDTMRFYQIKGDSISVPMLSQKTDYPYYNGTECEFLSMPFDNSMFDEYSAFDMVVILPHQGVDIKDASQHIGQYMRDDLRKLFPKLVSVYIPKFEVPIMKYELNPSLEKMGIKDIFEKGKLSEMSSSQIAIPTIVQAGTVKITKVGAEAGVATVTLGYGSAGFNPPKPIEFRCDRPFLYMIRERSSGLPLFMGQITKP